MKQIRFWKWSTPNSTRDRIRATLVIRNGINNPNAEHYQFLNCMRCIYVSTCCLFFTHTHLFLCTHVQEGVASLDASNAHWLRNFVPATTAQLEYHNLLVFERQPARGDQHRLSLTL